MLMLQKLRSLPNIPEESEKVLEEINQQSKSPGENAINQVATEENGPTDKWAERRRSQRRKVAEKRISYKDLSTSAEENEVTYSWLCIQMLSFPRHVS